MAARAQDSTGTRIRTRARTLSIAALLAIGLTAALLAGCAPQDTSRPAASGGDAQSEVKPALVRVGTLPTEDALPLWVAGEEGLFSKAGVEVEIYVFQAAAERDAALTAGSIDMMMGDITAAAALEAGGFPVSIATVMLGADASQGRFGIAVGPDSQVEEFADVTEDDVRIGTSSNTIQEYVMDKLVEQAGLDVAAVTKEEVKKVPVRFELLMQGKLDAAALPEPFLTLVEAQGGRIVADDTKGENISQTVLIVNDEYWAKDEGDAAVEALLQAWDESVAIINADPDAWRDTLVEQARLPEPIKDTYEVSTYPTATLPTTEQVDAVVLWMLEKKLLTSILPAEFLLQSP